MNVTGWSRGLEVTGGGQGVVSPAGLTLLRHLADKTGLTGGLSAALATPPETPARMRAARTASAGSRRRTSPN